MRRSATWPRSTARRWRRPSSSCSPAGCRGSPGTWVAGGRPALAGPAGFRLDDPAREVGIEFMLVTDAAGAGRRPTPCRCPTARAPLDGADGRAYRHVGARGPRHPVDLRRGARPGRRRCSRSTFVCGTREAQHQNRSDTPDPSVGRSLGPATAGRPRSRCTPRTTTSRRPPRAGPRSTVRALPVVRVVGRLGRGPTARRRRGARARVVR